LYMEGEPLEVQGNVIRQPYASYVRMGRIDQIDVFFAGQ
jgi:hypothetical protein